MKVVSRAKPQGCCVSFNNGHPHFKTFKKDPKRWKNRLDPTKEEKNHSPTSSRCSWLNKFKLFLDRPALLLLLLHHHRNRTHFHPWKSFKDPQGSSRILRHLKKANKGQGRSLLCLINTQHSRILQQMQQLICISQLLLLLLILTSMAAFYPRNWVRLRFSIQNESIHKNRNQDKSDHWNQTQNQLFFVVVAVVAVTLLALVKISKKNGKNIQ